MVPINPREEEIEGQKCAKSLTELTNPQEVSVSVVTPPGQCGVRFGDPAERITPHQVASLRTKLC